MVTLEAALSNQYLLRIAKAMSNLCAEETMKSKRYGSLLVAVAIALIVGVSAAADVEPIAVQLTDFQTIDLSPQKLGTSDSDTCSTHFPVYGVNVPGFAKGNETYYVYIDPATSSCSHKIPFGITGMKFIWCFPHTCSTSMVFKVFDAIPGTCRKPGPLLYSSPVTSVSIVNAGPDCFAKTISFGDTVCINAPFFLAYTLPDTVSCFEPYTDITKGLCKSYKFDSTWHDLGAYPIPDFPGQLWMQALGLDAAQSGCATIPETVMDITAVYQNIDTLEGRTVRVLGDYVHPNDSKLVTSYSEYEMQQLMPPQSVLLVTGVIPDSLYWRGGVVAAVGNISKKLNPTPVDTTDTLLVTINVLSYDYYFVGDTTTHASGIPELQKSVESGTEGKDLIACDPCKFAILISGGGDEANNKPGFWKDIEKLYNYDTSLAPTGGNYCSDNIKVLYYNGKSGNSLVIPDDKVDSCSKANLNAVIGSIAAQIQGCKSLGNKTTVQILVTNHGKDNGGFWTVGDSLISPAEFRTMQQQLVNAGCDLLIDEFTEGYGGDMVAGLKNIDDKGQTEIHVNSAAGVNSSSWVGIEGGAYLDEMITRLSAGGDYETAVAAAKTACANDLVVRYTRDSLRWEDIIKWLSDHPSHPDRNEWLLKKTRAEDAIGRLQQALIEGSPSFVRYQFKNYCEWKKIVIPPGGQSKLEFKGEGGCGNVSVYCEQDGSRKRVKIWNWNLDGSLDYSTGNKTRVLNADAPCTGAYWIHNDDDEFTVTAEALKGQTLPESPSNETAFSGFSVGGRDSSSAEFGNIIAASYVLSRIDSIGLDLRTIPSTLDTFAINGVTSLECGFTATSNSWWDTMEVVIDVDTVYSSGWLRLQCLDAQNRKIERRVDASTREIKLDLGDIDSTESPGKLVFTALSGLSFSWDSWGLHTRRTTYSPYVCGDASGDRSVDISDVVYLIAYIFSGGSEPVPLLAGDANCDGSVDISDVVYLIAYIFSGGLAPCAGCK